MEEALPRERYVDDATWRDERDAVLHGEWFCVGRRDDLGLAEPSRVVAVDVAGESVLVTSDGDGVLHASYNVCRHRGSQLRPVEGEPDPAPRACAASALRCPYHSWTYGLDGRLLRAPHVDEALDPERFSLAPVAVDTWAGFVFVHLTPDERRSAGRRGLRAGRQPGQLRHRRPRDGCGDDLRRRGQLQGGARELQRVLPLRPGPPRAVPAGAGLRRRRHRPELGGRRPPPRGRVDLHPDRHHHPGTAARA